MGAIDPLAVGGLYLGTFLFCAVSAVVPLVNCEIYLVGLGVSAARSDLLPLIVLAALGQMAGKCLLYLSGRGLLKLPLRGQRTRLEKVQARLDAGRWTTDGLTFLSAFTGIPPFYPLSVTAGSLRWSFRRFVLVGTCGRLLRFAVVLLLPALLKGVLS